VSLRQANPAFRFAVGRTKRQQRWLRRTSPYMRRQAWQLRCVRFSCYALASVNLHAQAWQVARRGGRRRRYAQAAHEAAEGTPYIW